MKIHHSPPIKDSTFLIFVRLNFMLLYPLSHVVERTKPRALHIVGKLSSTSVSWPQFSQSLAQFYFTLCPSITPSSLALLLVASMHTHIIYTPIFICQASKNILQLLTSMLFTKVQV